MSGALRGVSRATQAEGTLPRRRSILTRYDDPLYFYHAAGDESRPALP